MLSVNSQFLKAFLDLVIRHFKAREIFDYFFVADILKIGKLLPEEFFIEVRPKILFRSLDNLRKRMKIAQDKKDAAMISLLHRWKFMEKNRNLPVGN